VKRTKNRKALERIVVALLLAVVALAIIASFPDEQTASYHCTDSDDGSIYTRGEVMDWRTGLAVEDRCVDKTVLHEFSCEQSINDPRGKVKLVAVNCAYSCQKGRCVASDLKVTDVILDEVPRVGKAFDITFRIRNGGNYPAVVDLQVFFEPGYGLLRIPPPATLGPGESADVVYTATYTVPGTFPLVSVIDPYDVVAERDESNNQRSDDLTIHAFE